jgi:hypothetical protein
MAGRVADSSLSWPLGAIWLVALRGLRANAANELLRKPHTYPLVPQRLREGAQQVCLDIRGRIKMDIAYAIYTK